MIQTKSNPELALKCLPTNFTRRSISLKLYVKTS